MHYGMLTNYPTYRYKVVKIAIGGRGELQCAEADVIQSLVVYAECLIGVLHQLVH
jgi:hypothetical protein